MQRSALCYIYRRKSLANCSCDVLKRVVAAFRTLLERSFGTVTVGTSLVALIAANTLLPGFGAASVVTCGAIESCTGAWGFACGHTPKETVKLVI